MRSADDDLSGSLPLFIWGVLTAVALWWLYLRPAAPQVRLRRNPAWLRANTRTAAQSQADSASVAPPAAPPITPAAAEQATDDDLTRVYGIGPARAARLREAGITTFAALAVADAQHLRNILAGVAVGANDLGSWPEQASLAARGDWTGLQAVQQRLRAERA